MISLVIAIFHGGVLLCYGNRSKMFLKILLTVLLTLTISIHTTSTRAISNSSYLRYKDNIEWSISDQKIHEFLRFGRLLSSEQGLNETDIVPSNGTDLRAKEEQVHGMKDKKASDTASKGYVLCGANKFRPDLMRMIYQLRHTWKTSLPLTIIHCNEIDPGFHSFLMNFAGNDVHSLNILNICEHNAVKGPYGLSYSSAHEEKFFGMPRHRAERRLRGFFCKVGAMVASPYQETMIMDLDVVWFKNPEKLFSYDEYKRTGTLYFRDRISHGSRVSKEDFIDLFKRNDVPISNKTYKSNGISLVFGHLLNEQFPEFNEHQDSSVVMIDKGKQQKLMHRLLQWLPDFGMGYGDKEMFWISSLLVKQEFTWSPYLAGQYGDCDGIMLHYDPMDLKERSDGHALPLHINGNYMVEKELQIVGEFNHYIQTKPILATNAIRNTSLLLPVNPYPAGWTRDNFGCTCARYDCEPVDRHVNFHILLAQWQILSSRVSREGPERDCINIFVSQVDQLNELFVSKLSMKDCPILGCPFLPIAVDESFARDKKSYFCDPIVFHAKQDAQLEKLAKEARQVIRNDYKSHA